MNQKYFLHSEEKNPTNNRTVIDSHSRLFPLTGLLILLLVIGMPMIAFSTPSSHAVKTDSFVDAMAAAAEEDMVYVAVSNHNYLALIDPVAETVIDNVDLAPSGCEFPWYVAIPPDGASVWVSCRYSSKVIILDRITNDILQALDAQQSPAGITFTQDSAFALIGTNSSDDVIVVDTTSYAVAATVTTEDNPASIVMHPFLPVAYAAHRLYEGVVSVIDTTTWTVKERIKAGHNPHHATISRDGLWLYLANKNANTVSVVDIAARKLETDISIDAMPRDLAISPDGESLYVTRSWGDAIAIIDTGTNSVTQTLAFSGGNFDRPWGMELSCDGKTLVTTNSSGWGEENRQIALTDIDILGTTLLPLLDNDGDGNPDTGARGLAFCPQYVPEDIFLLPAKETLQANRGDDAIYSVTLYNFSGMEDSYTLTFGEHNWDSILSGDAVGPLKHGEAAVMTVTVTVPQDADWFSTDSVNLTATSVASPTVFIATTTLNTQAYAPPTMTISPLSLSSTQKVGEVVNKALNVANGLGVNLEFELGTSLGSGTSFATASTELYGYMVPGGYLQIIGLTDDTSIQAIDLENGSILGENNDLDRFEIWDVYLDGGTYFKLFSDKPVIAVETNGSYWGFNSFIPAIDYGQVGREFIFYHNQGEPSIYVFAIEDADIEFHNASGLVMYSISLKAGEYWKVNPESGVYHVLATGRIALELVAENAYTTVPSTDGRAIGQRFYFATSGWDTGGVAAFAYDDADIEVYDLNNDTLLHSAQLKEGEYWWQDGLENRQLRLESTGDVEVWAGNTEGSQGIEDLGDDISFAGGRLGREYYLHSLREGFVIFAPFDNTQISVDGKGHTLSKDEYMHFPDCCDVHQIFASQPILVQTLGRDGSWNDFGTYLGGVVAYSGQPVPWLATDPDTGVVPTNSSMPVGITFDADGVQPGSHNADLIVVSNDPSLPFLEIPVEMQVEPTADMGRVSGSVFNAWTGEPLAATIEIEDIYATVPGSTYEIWAKAGSYTLLAGANGFASKEFSIEIAAGENTTLDIELEPDLARLELDPVTVDVATFAGFTTSTTLEVANTGPALLEVSFHELPVIENQMALNLAAVKNRKILYDRAHDEPPLSDSDSLANDLITAGATIDQNFIYPIDSSALAGYDVLWINCCGYTNWTFSELIALKSWLDDGGAIMIHGGESPATNGPAEIYSIKYHSGCSYGTTANIEQHPITVNVQHIYVETCSYLTYGSNSILAVRDNAGQPHVIAHEQDRGKMVVVAGSDFYNWAIDQEDNRVLGVNIFAWLAEPGYEDINWLQIDPLTAQIPGHTSQEVTIYFDARNLNKGEYEAVLAVEHNDPQQATPVKLPVTFTVGDARGRIIVDKVTTPGADPQTFSFSLAGPDAFIEKFTLTDEAVPWDSDYLPPGLYSLAESVPSGWVQHAATCDDGSDPSNIQLDPGEKVTCMFTNRKLNQPIADFIATPTSGVPPLKVNLINLSSGDFGECLWDFGDKTTSDVCDNPTHTYPNPGTFTVSLLVKGLGGEDTLIRKGYITVYEPPNAGFSASPTSGPRSLKVDFTNLSTGDFVECLWDFGDNTTSNICNDPAHTYSKTGTFTVSLKVQGPGGEDVRTKADFITVYEPSSAEFSASPTSGVPPLAVKFTNLSTGDFNECLWDFGDNVTADTCNDPSHTYSKPGAFTVSLRVQGPGGEDMTTRTEYITIYQPPKAEFSASPISGAPPLLVTFENLSTGDFNECLWDFGGGWMGKSCDIEFMTYRQEGQYDVSLTVKGPGGEDTLTIEHCVKVAYHRLFLPGVLWMK